MLADMAKTILPSISKGVFMRLVSLKLVGMAGRDQGRSTEPIRSLLTAIGTRHHLKDLESVELDGSLGLGDDGNSNLCCLLTTEGINILPLSRFTVRPGPEGLAAVIVRFLTADDPTWNLQILGLMLLNGLLFDASDKCRIVSGIKCPSKCVGLGNPRIRYVVMACLSLILPFSD